jgi:hypothetical protein
MISVRTILGIALITTFVVVAVRGNAGRASHPVSHGELTSGFVGAIVRQTDRLARSRRILSGTRKSYRAGAIRARGTQRYHETRTRLKRPSRRPALSCRLELLTMGSPPSLGRFVGMTFHTGGD